MKGIFTMSAVVVAAVAMMAALTGCEKKGSGKLDPNSRIYINGATAPQNSLQPTTKAGQQPLTPREVVKQAQAMYGTRLGMSIGDWNRDTIGNRIVGSPTWVVAQNGTLETDLITARDIIFTTLDNHNYPIDTIAYIKNSAMDKAESDIRAAYNREDYATCYALFDEAFVFIPTTSAEYRELQKQGNN